MAADRLDTPGASTIRRGKQEMDSYIELGDVIWCHMILLHDNDNYIDIDVDILWYDVI